MSETTETRQHEITIEIDVPVEQVWAAITEADEIIRWFAPEAKVTPGVGGEMWISWGPGMDGTSKITVWEPNKHLQAGFGAVPQVVDYYLKAKEGKTVLRLVHSGFGMDAKFDNEYESTKKGWGLFFKIMKYGLERHPGVPCTSVVVYSLIDHQPAEVWKKLVSPEGLVAEGSLDGLRPGDHYRLRTSFGQVLEGVVISTDSVGYMSMTVEPFNDALLAIFCESMRGVTGLTFQLVIYGMEAARVDEIREQWDAFARNLYPKTQMASL